MVCKKLNSIKKRKDVIDKLFKKDKKSGMILMNYNFNALYESPGEVNRNITWPSLSKVEYINKSYTNIKFKQVMFLRNNNDPLGSGISDSATLKGVRLKDSEIILSRPIIEYIYNITYRSELDIFMISQARIDDITIGIGFFRNSKKIVFEYLESSDYRFAGNAHVSVATLTPTKYEKIPKDIQQLINKYSFDYLYKLVWDKINQKFDNKMILDNFPGNYISDVQILYSNPENQLSLPKFFYKFEEPIFRDENNIKALGRCIQSFSKEINNSLVKSGADGIKEIVDDKKKYNHTICSYSMYWDKTVSRFKVTLIDKDDTTVFSFYYTDGDDIIGEKFETPDVNKKGPEVSDNSFVSLYSMKKIESTSFDIPTYNELYAELKKKDNEN
jgi:hypothetical protein